MTVKHPECLVLVLSTRRVSRALCLPVVPAVVNDERDKPTRMVSQSEIVLGGRK